MGQCVSTRKSAGALMAYRVMTQDIDEHLKMGQGDSKNSSKRSTPYARGSGSTFGFKKRAHSAAPPSTKGQVTSPKDQVTTTATISRGVRANNVDNRIDDNNGNSGSLDSLTTPVPPPSGRSTPRLAPPKKEQVTGGTGRTNRFGFRQPALASNGPQPVRGPLGQLTARVSDVTPHNPTLTSHTTRNINNNTTAASEKPRPKSCDGQYLPITRQQTQIKLKSTTTTTTNSATNQQQQHQATNMMNQQHYQQHGNNHNQHHIQQQLNFPIRQPNVNSTSNNTAMSASRSKLAKQAVNSVRRRDMSAAGRMQTTPNCDVTPASQSSGGGVTSQAAPRRPRNLEMVLRGNKFEVRDMDDDCSSEEVILPLPKLPSAFTSAPPAPNTGLVRERTGDLQRVTNVNNGPHQTDARDLNSQGSTSGTSSIGSGSSNFGIRSHPNGILADLLDRKPSTSSSEAFVYDDEEKANRDRDISEKISQAIPSRDFSPSSKGSSPSSKASTGSNWGLGLGGEDLASRDALSLSSDGGADNSPPPAPKINSSLTHNSGLQALMTSSLMGSSVTSGGVGCAAGLLLRSAMEHDPKFAAVAAAADDSCLLDDETSPVDSLISSCTDSCSSGSEEQPESRKKSKSKKRLDASKDKDSLAGLLDPQNSPKGGGALGSDGPISGPGTPTNASNSLSLSDGGKDYFDDEIADQPALVFDDKNNASTADAVSSSLQLLSITDNTITLTSQDNPANLTHTLIGPRMPQTANRVVQTFSSAPSAIIQNAVLGTCGNSPSSLLRRRPVTAAAAVVTSELSRHGSLDTLSPCESIASDDLMMDFDHSHSSLDSDRAESTRGGGSALHSLDEAAIMSELAAQGGKVMKEWSTLLNARNAIQNANNGNGTQIPPAPARTARLLQRARASPPPGSRRTPTLRPPPHHGGTPGSTTTTQHQGVDLDPQPSAWIDRTAHNAMLQDVVGIKTMLLKLKRVLHETDTLNPFDRQPSPRHSYGAPGSGSGSSSGIDSGDPTGVSSESLDGVTGLELADLRRQVVFLQTQLEDKERTVQLLQLQMTKYSQNNQRAANAHAQNNGVTSLNGHASDEDKSCNAATQTERIRPISTGPTTYQQLGEANGLIRFRLGQLNGSNLHHE